MKIEAVTVCVNYADYLSHFLLHNKYCFDNLVVVTSNKDQDTADVCEHFYIKCIKSNIFDNEFNKGKALNLGLSNLQRDGWVCIIDSDIILPPRTRYLLEIAKLREDTLYGINRVMCPSWNAWAEFLTKPRLSHGCDIYIHNNQFPMGTSIGKLSKHPDDPSDLGYIPIGFFQLFYDGGSSKKLYPENHKNFARSDMDFAYQWDRGHRALIPEIVGIHLQTDDIVKMGQNWNNRSTKRFGPEIE